MTDHQQETSIDYQVSGPPMNEGSVLHEEDDTDAFIEFDFETQSVFKRLADDIYQSDEAGIREPLSNAITAAIQAEERYDVETPQVEITVIGGDQPTLILYDNGIGITENVLREVMAIIGRSMNRNRGDVTGKYGMGFLASYKLVGTNGGFIMHTNPRDPDDEPLSGLWSSGGFNQDTEEDFPNPLVEKGMHGTRFEFFLKDSISRHDVRDWVANCAEWARIPVVYNEFDEDGRNMYNEDYGTKVLPDRYANDEYVLSIETDHFEAYCAPSAESTSLLLDSPIKRNYNVFNDLPWDIDIRLKNENGVVVAGPHKGLEPVEDEEYEERNKEECAGCVPKSNLQEEDICLPGPIGTRDMLDREETFWGWLSDEFMDQYLSLVGDVVSNLTEEVSSFVALSDADRDFVMRALDNRTIPTATTVKLKESLKDETGAEISLGTAEMLLNLREEVVAIDRHEYRYQRTVSGGETKKKRAWKVHCDSSDGAGTVFMVCRPTPKKIRVAFDDSESNYVVKVDGREEYDKYQEAFGWEKLTNISRSNIDEFDVSEDVQEEFTSSDSESPKDSTLTIYYQGNNKQQSTHLTPAEIEKQLDPLDPDEDPGITYRSITTLVLFPRPDHLNVSDNKWLANKRIAVASCSGEEWECLKQVDGVERAVDYFRQARFYKLPTVDGKVSLQEIDIENTIFHIVSEDWVDTFRETEIMQRVQEYVQTLSFRGGRAYSDATYIPLTRKEMDILRPHAFPMERDSAVVENPTKIIVGDTSAYDCGEVRNLHSDTRVYAHARLPEWEDTPELETIATLYSSLGEGGYETIETFGLLHDNGEDPHSSRRQLE